MLQSGLSISEMERQLIDLGIDAETARSAAEFGAARIAMSPYEYLFSSSQARSRGQGDFFSNLFEGLGGFGGGSETGGPKGPGGVLGLFKTNAGPTSTTYNPFSYS